jgi:molecular chaperone DnaK (HSP70)
MLKCLLFSAVVLLLLPLDVHCNVMGIDLGSEFIKIASPKGNSTIDIVLNEQTRRKSQNYIGFRSDDRFLSEDAKNFAARFPNNMFTMIHKLVGVEYGSKAFTSFQALQHTFSLTKNEKRSSVDIRCGGNPNTTYSSEELLAMIIGYAKEITKKDSKIQPNDAVITIPAYYSMSQRQALVDAASLADVRVLALMHSTTAAALQFGMQRRGFGNDTVNVVIFDMGATKTEVGVYTFSPPVHPKEGRIKLAVSMGTMTTRYIATDETLGGRTFDFCIAKMLEDEIVAKLGIPRLFGGTTLQQHKAIFSLMRAANGARETLSANVMAPVTVESVAPDRDFSTKVTREQFEEQCSGLFARAVELADKALKGAGLTPSDITSFEMMGGGVRPAKVIADLSTFLGRTVDRTLNSDEAAAFGAAYYGSRLSGYFRVKSFAINDYLPSQIYFQLSSTDNVKTPAKRVLFEKSLLGTRKSITVNRTSDFNITLFASHDDGVTSEPLSVIRIRGITEALEELNFFSPKIKHDNNTHIVRVELRLNDNGIIVVEEVEVRFRYASNVSKKVKRQVTNETTEAESVTESLNETSAESNETTEAVVTYDTVFEIQMKRRSANAKATLSLLRPLPLDAEDITASKAVLSALDKADKLKRATATAKNNLETYIQWAKGEGVLENEELREKGFLSAGELESIRAMLLEVQEWSEDGEGSYDTCTKEEFDEKLALVKNATSVPLNKLEASKPKPKPKPSASSIKKKNKTKDPEETTAAPEEEKTENADNAMPETEDAAPPKEPTDAEDL